MIFVNNYFAGVYFNDVKLRNFACDLCDKTQQSANTQRRHTLLEMSAKRFLCDICDSVCQRILARTYLRTFIDSEAEYKKN
jgi:hypothetical protein